MRKWIAVLALFAGLALVAPARTAAQGKGKGRGNPHASKNVDDDRWERREGYEYRTYGEDEGGPPGWSKGKKTGWGNCGLPPGQAKKYGTCRMYTYQGRPHYWYRDDRGRIIVRRPAIHVHGGADVN